MTRGIFGKAIPKKRKMINRCISSHMKELLVRENDKEGYYLTVVGQQEWANNK